MPYSDDDKAKAVSVYRTHGATVAAETVGCDKSTVTRWAQAAGIETEVISRTSKATEVRAAANEATRQRLRDKILAKAEDMLDRMDLPHHDYRTAGKNVEKVHWDQARSGDVKNYAIAFGVLLDKYRLEMGESTDRREVSIVEAESAFDREIKKLAGRLGDNDK